MSQAWIEEMAALWFVKAQDGMSVSEKNAFEKWLHVNPKHQKAYTEFEALWSELDALVPASKACSQKCIQPWWGYVSACIATVFVIVFMQWQTWSTRPEFVQTMSTPVGSMREYTLQDGTTLFLDTNTQLKVEYYKQKRLVTLYQGQIVLHVSKDKARPLFVETQNVQVRVIGTRFEVRNVSEHVRVSVEEGSVEVSYKQEKDSTILLANLHAKDQLTLDEQGLIVTSSMLQNDSIAPWRSGRLVFDQTPLKEVLFEFERYGAKKAVIDSPKLASMTLSGSFEIERYASFLELLPKVLPLKIVNLGNEVVIVQR